MANSSSAQPICWNTPDQFAFDIQLVTLDGRAHALDPELVTLDTGYDGAVLVPYSLHVSLGLRDWELPQSLWPRGLTVSGERLLLPVSQAVLAIPKLDLQIRVLTDTFEGNTEFLIGRALIQKLRVLLDGPASQTCILPDSTDS